MVRNKQTITQPKTNDFEKKKKNEHNFNLIHPERKKKVVSQRKMTAAAAEEPILCRLDRIDNMVKRLEEIRVGGGNNNNNGSPRSSCGSTPSSGTLTSDGGRGSFTDFSPKSLEKHCRPIDDVMMETEHKGTLLQRLVHVEDRVLKLSLEMEQELMMEKKKREEEMMNMRATITTTDGADEEQQQQHNNQNQKKKKGFKQLVKSCVTGGGGRRKT